MGRLGLWICLPALIASAAMAQPGAPVTGVAHTTDVDLAYEVYGAALTTPVIVVNGGPGLSHKYMLQNDVWTRRIAAGRQVVFYDQRGTGKSLRVAEGVAQTMAAQVGDLDAVRAHLGFEKVDIAGDSYGGLLSMAYVAAHPEHVRKLILSDSAPPAWKDMVHLLPQVFPDIEEQDAEIAKKQTDPDKAAQEQLVNHFRMIFYSEELMHAYLDGIGDLGSTPKVGDAVFKAIADIDLTAELAKIKAPTLVITGRYDMNVAPLTAWRMYKAIPGAKIEIFAKSGHLPYYEEPEKYARVVSVFLDGNSN